MTQKNYLVLTNVIKTNLLPMKKILILLLLTFCNLACKKKSYEVSKINFSKITISSEIKQDSLIVNSFMPYKNKMIEEVNKPLSYASSHMVRTDGNLQSTLGNLIADLCYEKANELFNKKTGKNIDFLMSNYGGIRAPINKGKVTVSNTFELMPFDNTLVVVELNAKKVEALFNYFIKEQKAHPLSKQVQLTIKNDSYEIRISGKPIKQNKTYFVATSNYLQKGGDSMIFFKDPISLYDSNFLIRDAITDHFNTKDTLKSNLDKRIVVIK